MKHWSILYRGPLSSCNYTCSYCPFGKTRNSKEELEHDAACVRRFVRWVATRSETIGVLFTPWGEGLIRPHYQDAMVTLSHLPNCRRVAIQTNLSCRLEWLRRAQLERLALWTTWHPTQVSMSRFVARCHELDELGVRYSVGVVGLHDAIDDVERLRERLSPNVYLWVNAYKRVAAYYDDTELARLTAVDPLFALNNQRHASAGEACFAGETSFTVDGAGDVRRCHFIDQVIGNIYEPGLSTALRPRACVNATCGCHIGYVHLKRLGLDTTFGEGLLERIPAPTTSGESSAS